MKKYWISGILIALFLSGCMRTVYVPVLRPAPIDVGRHIQNIAIIDRSETERTTRNVIESVVTGELPGMHKEAAQRAIDGVLSGMQSSPRFAVLRTTENFTTNSFRGNWPELLTWDEVGALCAKYQADAILSLESFDSDFVVTNGSRVVESKDKDGNKSSRTEYFAEGIARVKIGFRMYDFETKSISDERMYEQTTKWDAKGRSIRDAMLKLMNHRQAVLNTAYTAGEAYATRISPRWVRLNREFFKKGKGNFDFNMGVRRATVNDWDGAIEAWERSLNARNRKTAGRSAYNLALMYEINGELERARDMAQRSYTDYGIKKARSYTYALERRIREQRITDEQMQ